ncbi:MAG: alcohol dehydrogenase catalytic domain-containing protein [Alphaproteobacteria bacterium]
MRGVVFTGNRTLEVTTFPDPAPGPGQAVIRMKASGICGSDLHFYRAEDPIAQLAAQGFKLSRDRAKDTRIIAGHEPCGVIEEVAPDVDPARFRKGDRVMVFHYEGCGVCDHCRSGWTQMCVEGAAPHGAVLHGGHADFMRVPVSTLVKLPDEVSFVGGAAIACGTGTAYGAICRLGVSARDTLAVFGLGPVGLSVVRFASAMGVPVIGIDIDASRVEAARRFGAAHAVNGKTDDPVEEVRKLTKEGVASLRSGLRRWRDRRGPGRSQHGAMGPYRPCRRWRQLQRDRLERHHQSQRTCIGSYTFSIVGMRRCAEFIASGVDIDLIFSDRWSITDAAQAYEKFDSQASGKGVFIF